MKDIIFLLGVGVLATIISIIVVGAYYYFMWGYMPWWEDEDDY